MEVRNFRKQFSDYSNVVAEKKLGNGAEAWKLKRFLGALLPGMGREIFFPFFRKAIKKDCGPSHLAWRGRYPKKEYEALIDSGYSMVGVVSYAMLESVVEFLNEEAEQML